MLPAFLLLLTGAVAVDNSPQIKQLIGQTRTDIIATNRTFDDYESFSTVGIDAALNTYNNASAISTDLQNTITAVQASDRFSLDNSEDIFVGLTGLLPPVFDLLDNLVKHCNAYLSLGVASLVLDQLTTQRDLTNQETSAVIAKSSGDYPALLNFGTGLLLDRFDRAVDIFQSANDLSTCPPPGSTAFPSSGATRTVTVTATGAPGSTVTRVSTVTRTVTASAGGAPGQTVTKTVTAPGKTVTSPGKTVTAPGKTVTVGGPGKTVTAPGKTVTVGCSGKTVTKTATITKGPTVTKTLPGKTVTTHCTVTVTKTVTIKQY